MARVIYTGPLNPVIFARAKKEAEKAERIKGYTPRVIKTPSHTVVYSKTGPEVKAVVMDMLAPITFSIPGSAIPVAPSFIHLHPDLPEKVYGRENYAKATGATRNWGLGLGGAIDNRLLGRVENFPYGNAYYFSAWKRIPGNKYRQDAHDYSFFESSIKRELGFFTPFDAANYYAKPEDVSNGIVNETQGVEPPFNLNDVGEFVFSINNNGVIVDTEITGSSINSYSVTPTEYESIKNINQDFAFDVSYSSNASTDFLNLDIRNHKFSNQNGIEFKSIKGVSHNIKNSLYYRYGVSIRDVKVLTDRLISGVGFSDARSIGFYGEKIHSFIDLYVKGSSYFYESDGGNFENSAGQSLDVTCSVGIAKNLSNRVIDLQTIKTSQIVDDYQNTSINDVKFAFSNVRVFLFASSSVGLFDGVFISATAFDVWDGNDFYPFVVSRTVKRNYGSNSAFSKSHLRYYFDFDSNGEYMLDDNVHTKPPRLTTDGICLPHAWFFCRGNETRETDFYPNNHNRLSIVIYPQGRHEFSVDEAEIVSVELNHTPRFVSRPGGGIAFVMQSLFGGNKLVPYVVNGLVEERDEYGEPTGFYLAQDGAISGEFKAPANGGDPVVSFKLSPRQAFDGYRTVTVETTTGREYGVQTTFEVQGSGGVRVQQPPSITLERINESVLAGQSTVFYVTATQIAVGSNLRYEIKRAGTVVSAGYIELGNCAGWVEFTAPFQSVSVPGDPVRYVLSGRSAPSTTPSTVEFEFSLVHEQAPPPVTFSVKFAHELYASSTDRPAALPMPPLFFLQPLVSENGEDGFIAANYQTTLINRIYYSLQSKRVYVLFWDGQSCDVSGILKQNPESGQYEYNQDWKETPFDYPPAVDPYNIKGTLEPYVYAYMDYENNRNNGA